MDQDNLETDRDKEIWNAALCCAQIEIMCAGKLRDNPEWESLWDKLQNMKQPFGSFVPSDARFAEKFDA